MDPNSQLPFHNTTNEKNICNSYVKEMMYLIPQYLLQVNKEKTSDPGQNSKKNIS